MGNSGTHTLLSDITHLIAQTSGELIRNKNDLFMVSVSLMDQCSIQLSDNTARGDLKSHLMMAVEERAETDFLIRRG